MVLIDVTVDEGAIQSGRAYLNFGQDGWIVTSSAIFRRRRVSANISRIGFSGSVYNFTILTMSSDSPRTHMGYVNMNPSSEFTESVRSFMLTSNNLLINVEYPHLECAPGHHLVLLDHNPNDARWYFRNAYTREPIVFDTFHSITLSGADLRNFLSQVLEIAHSNSISTTMNHGQNRLLIDNCDDIDMLDDVLPVLSYALETRDRGDGFSNIEFSARDYLKRENYDFSSCLVDVEVSPRTDLLFLGSPLFRKYPVYFNNERSEIGICIANS